MKKAMIVLLCFVLTGIMSACAVKVDVNVPTQPPADDTELPAEDFSAERRILGGEAEKADMDALYGDGLMLDVDNDGVKNKLTAKKANSLSWSDTQMLFVDGEPRFGFENGADLWLISLFGDGIEIAAEGAPCDSYEEYLFCSGAKDIPTEDVKCIRVACLYEKGETWAQCGTEMIFTLDSVKDIERRSSVEEYILDGARVELGFPRIAEMDENNDISVEMDIDGDGKAESLLFKANRARILKIDEQTGEETLVTELPYRTREDLSAILAEYSPSGLAVNAPESSELWIDGVKFESPHGGVIGYNDGYCFAPDGEGGIMILQHDLDWTAISYRNGAFSYKEVANTED